MGLVWLILQNNEATCVISMKAQVEVLPATILLLRIYFGINIILSSFFAR